MNKIGWGFIGLGTLFLVVGVWIIWSAFSSSIWPTTQGVVTEAKVTGQISQAGDALRRHIVYSIQISYDYEVNNTKYQSKRYSMGSGNTVKGNFNDKTTARDWLRQSAFQSGRTVTVYVDPRDPENTVLSAGINWASWIPGLLGLILLVFGYWMVFSLHPKVLQQASK